MHIPRPLFLLGSAVALITAAVVVLNRGPVGPVPNPDPNHTHADFAVWIENRKLDFTDPKYMSAPPPESAFRLIPAASAHTVLDEGEHLAGREYLHLHDGNGSVIHRHKPGLTLNDFFVSLGFHMTESCFVLDTGREVCPAGDKRWQMFVNGEEKPWTPYYAFQDLDRILLTYGATPEQVQAQLAALTDDACLYSRVCPERGTPPTENCIADPTVPCVVQ